MKRILSGLLFVLLMILYSIPCRADCAYDHLMIGCNEDGEPNTPDDRVLFLDTDHLYRRTDPNRRDEATWLHWYYTLFPVGGDPEASTYVISEPGFDMFSAEEDPARCLTGTAELDYRIIVECLDIAPGFRAASLFGDILLEKPGDWFDHSAQSEGHVHLYYTAPAPGNEVYWIQYRVYDAFWDPADPNSSGYLPSRPVTVVFGRRPVEGDVHVDRKVDLSDLEKLCNAWLLYSDCPVRNARGQAAFDFFDRADINRDYRVDVNDWALLSRNWME